MPGWYDDEAVGVACGERVTEVVALIATEGGTVPERDAETDKLAVQVPDWDCHVADAVMDTADTDAVGDPEGATVPEPLAVRDAVPVDVRVAETGERLAVCVGV